MRRIAVVGNGIAGITAAESVRNSGFDGDLTIIGDEQHAAYSRPALSKAALLDDDPEHLRLPAATHGGRELLGRRAQRLDLDAKVLHLSSGEPVPFDGLVLATGSRARRLSSASDELTLRGLEDMTRLRARLAERPSVLVVGSGPLAMEVASGAMSAGCGTTLISRGLPLRRHLGDHLARLLLRAAIDRGLVHRASRDVTLRPDGAGSRAVLSDGTSLWGEVVVAAVGDAPAIQWLTGSGLLSDGHLIVDARGRVVMGGRARPDIVAAGDLATVPTPTGSRRIPLWTSAIDQAKVAGQALVRGDEAPPLSHRPYFWTDQFGHNVRVCGDLPPVGPMETIDSNDGSALLLWPGTAGGPGTAAAVNYRIPIPRLRRLTTSDAGQPP